MVRRVWLLTMFVAAAACAVAGGGGTPDAGKDAPAPTDAAGESSPPADSGGADSAGGDSAGGDSGGSDGGGVDAPAETSSGVAVLQVNEVGPNISGSADLIELMATKGGDTGGITVEEDITSKTLLATLPSITVVAGDFVVVHLNAPAGVTTETASRTDCTDAACFGSAWDVVGGTTGVTYSGRVILTRAPNAGAIQDGVAFYNSSSTSPASFYLQVEALQTAGAWLPADCSGNPCSSNTLAQGVSANWAGTGTTSAKSVARTANGDTDTAGDWVVGTSSFGVTNP